jgi:hypothetical protein
MDAVEEESLSNDLLGGLTKFLRLVDTLSNYLA